MLQLEKNLTPDFDYTSTQPLRKAYWRLDYEAPKPDSPPLPFVVIHNDTHVVYKLVLIHSLLTTGGNDELVCLVDLPDGIEDKKTSLQKYFGVGKTLVNKHESFERPSLRRSMVIDHTGEAVPGFPSIVLRLPMSLCPPIERCIAGEVHSGWAPPMDMTPAIDAKRYLKLFQTSGPANKDNIKALVEGPHKEQVEPWPEVSFLMPTTYDIYSFTVLCEQAVHTPAQAMHSSVPCLFEMFNVVRF